MSSAVTEKDRPPITIDDDLQSRLEAQNIKELENEGTKGESGKAKAEELRSASSDDIQEDNKEHEFDEDADWSDIEGKEFDIFEEYNFVWTEIWSIDGKAYKAYEKGDAIVIFGSADSNQAHKPFPCTANFTWCHFVAQFTCIYRPETQTFTDFKAKRKTLDGGLEDLEDVTVRMWKEIWTKETGEWVGKKKEVKDDRGHLLLYVHTDFGTSAAIREEALMYGKKVVSDGGEANVALTEGEKERLGLLESDTDD